MLFVLAFTFVALSKNLWYGEQHHRPELAYLWRGGRVVEGTPLLREQTPKASREFESRPLRHQKKSINSITYKFTGFGDETNAVNALRNGSMAFLRKPIDVEEMFALMNKVIEKLTLKRVLKYRSH